MSRRIARFALHYLEMVVAMLVGMLVLGLPAVWALEVVGSGDHQSWAIELRLLGMAIVMTVPMVAWMRVRGHGPRPMIEISAAMFGAMLLRPVEYIGHAHHRAVA